MIMPDVFSLGNVVWIEILETYTSITLLLTRSFEDG